MDYVALHIQIAPVEHRELLYPILAELGFDSFQETEKGLDAFVPAEIYAETMVADIQSHPWFKETESLEIAVNTVAHTNWNAVWEANFEPIGVDKELRIRAPFHSADTSYNREIIIAPQMSFGTGHHETTWMMCKALLDINCEHQHVLDMGCGTGILAILAEMLGADKVVGVEIEDMAVQNAIENGQLNNSEKTTFIHGDAAAIPHEKFGIIVANINRNILLQDLQHYVAALKSSGSLLLSGFYVFDNPKLIAAASELGLELYNKLDRNDWSLLYLKKRS